MEKGQWPPPPRPRVVAPRRRITAHQRQAVPPFCVCNLNIFLAGLARFLGIVLATILAWLWAVINLQLCLALALAFRYTNIHQHHHHHHIIFFNVQFLLKRCRIRGKDCSRPLYHSQDFLSFFSLQHFQSVLEIKSLFYA